MNHILKSYRISALLLVILIQIAPAQSTLEPRPGKPVTIPTRYLAHRFVATPTTIDNVTLSLFTDSAGGLFLYEDVAERLKLSVSTMGKENGRDIKVAPLPSFKASAGIPPPLGSLFEQRLFLFPRRAPTTNGQIDNGDGMLGQQWFAGRVWTFDYPKQTLLWRAAGDLPPHDKSHEVPLGFKTAPSGKRQTNFARIAIEVDGETLDFVLDTGATNILPDDVLKQINDGGPAERATSFLARSIFERWHKKHPEWRALENIKTLTGAAMIEVPAVTIAGFTVGPVWFTVQPDLAFHSYMAQFMDKPTEGAIGGSALHYLRMTVDWPNAVAVFERPRK
jgi:hypothetical protein